MRCLEAQEEANRQAACERIIRRARLQDSILLGKIAADPPEGLTPAILQDISGTGWIKRWKIPRTSTDNLTRLDR